MASDESRDEGPAGAEDASGSSGASGASGASGGEDGVWDDVVLDDDFIRSAEAAEPSARARMLSARWRDGAPEPQPWRSDEPPAGWFFSRRRKRRRRK
ncbi:MULTISPECIES: SGM_3592 family protein [Streptomyces]|uniref:Uncharacterized protein n=1 Tax=Streptomyces lasiicapitis TaxID=1923961 RepID=A0ABQ2LVK9_9ACTN|nr:MULTISPECIES: hypothetical protein [Streptomyces]GGO43646.1 hypothetical protein GCM10012286_28010 [Streptomyces lasiicapitis]